MDGDKSPVNAAPLKEPRLTWATIDYTPKLPQTFVVPENHWPKIAGAALNSEQKLRLNHFAAYFMCEMFVHFELSIIHYFRQHAKLISRFLSERQMKRFVDEELDHVDAFEKLARRIRPDLAENMPRFLVTNAGDNFVVKHTPLSAFFAMASLFEEMTIFVYDIMREHPEQSWQPIADVMRLHALEEKGHIGMDRIVADGVRAERSRFRIQIEMLTLLPLVAYCDRRIASSWKKASVFFAREENLSSSAAAAIRSKGLSQSDILGMRSFVRKVTAKPMPGAGPLCFFLNKLTA